MIPVSFGCDAEFFLIDRQTNKPVSPHPYTTGTKSHPEKIDGGALQLDGLAVEINTVPAYNFEMFNRSFIKVMTELRKRVPSNLRISCVPYVWFDKDYWEKEVPEESKILGCDPDYTVRGDMSVIKNPRPVPPVDLDGRILRTSGGHVHIGWTGVTDPMTELHVRNCSILIDAIDRYYYPIHKIITPFKFGDVREKLYGGRGCFRPKTYGVEYRTPNSTWLYNTSTMQSMFNVAIRVSQHVMNGQKLNLSRDIKVFDSASEFEKSTYNRTGSDSYAVLARDLHTSNILHGIIQTSKNSHGFLQ